MLFSHPVACKVLSMNGSQWGKTSSRAAPQFKNAGMLGELHCASVLFYMMALGGIKCLAGALPIPLYGHAI